MLTQIQAEAIEANMRQNPKLNLDNKISADMLNRFNQGLEDLFTVAQFLETEN